MKIYRSIDLGTSVLSEKLAGEKDLQFHFEPMNDQELFSSDFDLIELSESHNQLLLQQMPMLDWNIQATRSVDAFMKFQNNYKPLHLGAMSLVKFLQHQHISLDISKIAVLVGGYSFLISYAMSLCRLGYKKIILVSPEKLNLDDQIQVLRKILFQVEITSVTVEEMANTSELASILAIDFDADEYPELVEILTYFNFLTEKALFFDQQSYLHNSLSTEAEKAQLKVLDSLKFHVFKYHQIQKILNNRS